jgi:GT2 family glycosyltransferase
MPAAEARPAVSVIVPFAGPQLQLEEMLRRLAQLRFAVGDEAVLVDNRPAPTVPSVAPAEPVRVLAAGETRSSWYARNCGAAVADGDWLVFIDSDTRPAPDLLDRYFDPPPAADVGVLVGAVRDWARVDNACTRYVTSRRKMDQTLVLEHPYGPYGQTANCAVRRQAFNAIRGFPPEPLSGGDADICWRLQAAGWRLESRPAACVEHENRARFRDLLRQIAAHGTSIEWLNRRHPGSGPGPGLRELVGRVPHYLRAAARAPSREEALFALVDLACLYARDFGRRLPPTR